MATTTETTEQTDYSNVPDIIVEDLASLAVRAYDNGDYENARELLQNLAMMRPENAKFWTLLGVTARKLGHDKYALVCFREAMELEPENRNVLVNLGETLCKCYQFEAGVEVLEHVFKMGHDPSREPEEQDEITRRAGLDLAFLRETVRKLQEYEAEQEEQEEKQAGETGEAEA